MGATEVDDEGWPSNGDYYCGWCCSFSDELQQAVVGKLQRLGSQCQGHRVVVEGIVCRREQAVDGGDFKGRRFGSSGE